jgi:hypothetical protein
MGRLLTALCIVALTVTNTSAGLAQTSAPTPRAGTAAYDAAWRRSLPEPATIQMPRLEFSQTAADEQDYDKYYYFNRVSTSFADALADLRDCDELSHGLRSSNGVSPALAAQYGLASAAIANVLVVAIFGSSAKRQMRRENMRRCMHYKGYARYGLRKDLWNEFNFEEGFSGLDEPKRQAYLFQQAKVASGPTPAAKELGI